MGTVHTVAVHFRYALYMRRLANEFLYRNPIPRVRLFNWSLKVIGTDTDPSVIYDSLLVF